VYREHCTTTGLNGLLAYRARTCFATKSDYRNFATVTFTLYTILRIMLFEIRE